MAATAAGAAGAAWAGDKANAKANAPAGNSVFHVDIEHTPFFWEQSFSWQLSPGTRILKVQGAPGAGTLLR
jgi:hypothetical protein